MRYPEIIKRLSKRGSILGLDPINGLLSELGHPEQNLRIVHIAGTNGKGSVFAFLAQILKESGFRVGRYISPAVLAYEEKFQIDGKMIGKDKLEACYLRMEKALEALKRKGKPEPTLFEVETAIAFCYFKDEKTDFALIETGMGGRLDATNIIKRPDLTMISSVSMDHQEYLGDTLEAIAGEKAGIIKEGTPVILAENPPEVCRVILRRAEEMNAPCLKVNADDYKVVKERPDGSTFIWKKYRYQICLPGRHQISNAAAALLAAEELGRSGGYKIDAAAMKNGLKKTRWPGRLEIIGHDPVFYRDGAHNPDGARNLAQFLEKHFTNKRIIYIMGVLGDKDYRQMLRFLMPLAVRAYVFCPNVARGLSARVLAEAVEGFGVPAVVCPDVNTAVRQARESAEKEDILVACGSLSFMEAMEV